VSAFGDVRAELVGKLTAAGIAATDNPASVPPFVLVGVPEVPAAVGVGAWAGEFPVWIVTPPPDQPSGLAWRLDRLEEVYAALGFAPARIDRWGDKDCPAYLLTYPRQVPNPAC